jgi:orotidine-5'-phosphate decarboxylase
LPRLAVALDGASLEPLEPLIDALAGLPVLAKVGMSLFSAVGPSVVHHLRAAGLPVYLDLNLCDIPHQVGQAVDNIARLGVELVSVYACGGRAMLEAAQRAARGRVRVLGTTVLTSMDAENWAETGQGGDLQQAVAQQLRLVADCGLAGAVLSAGDLGLAQDLRPSFLRVTPGIRPPTSQAFGPGRADDQRRTATAEAALAAGASILVVGRPLLGSSEPREAVLQLLRQIDQAPDRS